MDVDRHAIDLAADGAAVEQALRPHDLGPLVLGGEVGEVAHQPGLHQFLRLPAMVELGGAHRVAAGDAADHDRPGGAAGAGDGAVDPVIARRIERLGEFGHRRGLAARRPPVGDLQIGRRRRPGNVERDRRGKGGDQDFVSHFGFLPEPETLQIFR